MRAGLLVGAPYMAYAILLGLHAPIELVDLLEITAGAGITASNAMWWTTLQQNVPKQAMSRVIAYEYASTLSIIPVGAALAGPFGHAVGFSTALIVCAAATITIKVSTLLVPRIRNLELVSAR